MPFPVRNFTRLDCRRLDILTAAAEEKLEAFLACNPSRRSRAFIQIEHAGRGRYRARGKYSSEQGISSPVCVFSEMLEGFSS